jgi:hypothetical protein
MALFYFGKSRVFLPKLLGAFLAVLAAVMFIVVAGQMFDTWDAMQKYPGCIAQIGTGTDQVSMMRYLDCKDSLYRITGLQLRADQPKITTRQFAVTLLTPIANLLWWAAVFTFGLFLYNTRIVRPAGMAEPALFGKKRKKK